MHLLPCNDIATIEEDRSRQLDPGPLDHFPPDSEEQQRRVGEVRERDGFNWGYDPLHYLAPEGSYAVEDRTREFRAMVRALNGIGLRVVLDVVFNHTPGTRAWTRSSPATTTGSRRPARSTTRRAARTPRPSTG